MRLHFVVEIVLNSAFLKGKAYTRIKFPKLLTAQLSSLSPIPNASSVSENQLHSHPSYSSYSVSRNETPWVHSKAVREWEMLLHCYGMFVTS